MQCEGHSVLYPLHADIFYPDIAQSAYGNVTKSWILDRTLYCSLGPAGSRFKEALSPNVDISLESTLIGRFKEDIRIANREIPRSITNIIITNVRDCYENQIYTETSGQRIGKPTIFEIATVTPHVGPFGTVEYYRVILKRSENQGVDL